MTVIHTDILFCSQAIHPLLRHRMRECFDNPRVWQVGAFLTAEATGAGAAYAEQPAAAFSLAPGSTLECELPRTMGGVPGHDILDPDPSSSTGAPDEEDEEALLERLTAREAEPQRPPPVLRLREAVRCGGHGPGSGSSESPTRSPERSLTPCSDGGSALAGGGGGWSDPVALLPGSTSVGGGRWRVRVWRRGCIMHMAVLPGAASESASSEAGSTGVAASSCADADTVSSGSSAPAGAPLSVQLALESLQVATLPPHNATLCIPSYIALQLRSCYHKLSIRSKKGYYMH